MDFSRIQNFGKSDEKTIKIEKTENFHVILRYGRSCQDIGKVTPRYRWIFLRVGKKITQQLKKMTTLCVDDHQFQEEKNWNW